MSKGPMNTVVVRETIHVRADGETERPEMIEIGTPFPADESGHEWICPVHAPGLGLGNRHVHGGSALQALCLALGCIRAAIELLREQASTVSYERGANDDFSIKSTFALASLNDPI